MMDFNPNKPAQTKNFIYATFIPDRRPQFKMYSNRGHALNSFQYRDSGILYTWENEQWVEVYRIENYEANDNCELCSANMVENTTQYAYVPDGRGGTTGKRIPYKRHRGHRVWLDKDTKNPRLAHVCYGCERKMRRGGI